MKERSASITTRSVNGGLWTVSAQVISRVVDLVTLMILARVLEPSDFGLVAIAMSIIFVAEAILELPTSSVLIVTAEPTDEMLATAFTLGLMRALLVAAVACAGGFLLAQVYSDSRLMALTSVLALAPAFRGMTSPNVAMLAQDFRFKPLFTITVFGKIVALALSVSLALSTRSYWSIAVGTVAAPIAMAILSYRLAPYRPRLSLGAWPLFAGYLSWNALSQFMSAMNWQLDRLVLPRHTTTLEFGWYVTGSEIVALPFKSFAQPIGTPLLAGFHAARGRSTTAFVAAYLQALDVVLTVMLPIAAIIALLSEQLLAILLGAKWTAAAPIVTWLALISMLSIPRVIVGPLFLTLNRPRLITLITGVELAIKAPLIMALIPSFGISGALVAQGCGVSVVLLFSSWLIHRHGNVPLKAQLRVLVTPAVAVLAMCTVTTVVGSCLPEARSAPASVFRLALLVIMAACTYLTAIYLMWIGTGRRKGFVTALLRRGAPAFGGPMPMEK